MRRLPSVRAAPVAFPDLRVPRLQGSIRVQGEQKGQRDVIRTGLIPPTGSSCTSTSSSTCLPKSTRWWTSARLQAAGPRSSRRS